MKNALVTGASHGIGQAIAVELARSGFNVAINYGRNAEGAKKTEAECQKAGVKTAVYQADISDCSQLSEMFNRFEVDFGRIDLMVNNAGVSEFFPFLEVTEENWRKVTFTDWKGAFFGTQYAAKNMVKYNNREGLIVNISSNHVDGCWPNATIYGPTKAALTKFGKNAAMELAQYGIRVITLAPGYTDVGWDPKTGIYDVMERIPLGRFGKPEEIAKIVAFVASPACAYMTGNCITVDGGALLPVLTENNFFKGVDLCI